MNKQNLIKWIVSGMLCVAMLAGMMPAVFAAGTTDAPAQTGNLGDYQYTYDRWANPINSYLVPNDDGTITRVEYTGEAVAVETYDSSLQFVGGMTIDVELPLFGGFYSGTDSNFLVFGQNNPDEDDSVEVVRVVRYTKDWQRVASASLLGANTYIPFDAGSLRFAEYGGYLYIRTAHEMYMSEDGLHHQSNMTLNVRIEDMVITDSFYEVMNVYYGYVSHSFNQFILVDGTDLVAVDHGDAYPRSVVLIRYNAPAGQDSFMQRVLEPTGTGSYRYVCAKNVDVLPIAGTTGSNDTGVALGGFEASSTHYLIAGNTVSQGDDYDPDGQRNIFVSATSKSDFTAESTTINYLTSYVAGDNVTLSNPHFVKVDTDRYMVLWEESGSETSGLRYAYVDGNGALTGEIYTAAAMLSDCQPIVSDGKVIWYVTSGSAPAFFTIDLDTNELEVKGHVYAHEYTSYPGYDSAGSLSSVCSLCGAAGDPVTVPAIKGSPEYSIYHVITAPTCTEDGVGYYQWKYWSQYGVPAYIYNAPLPATGHSYADGVCSTCGAEDPDYTEPVIVPTLTLVAPSLNFEDEIYYNVYYTASDMTDVVEMGLITFDGYLAEGTIDDALEVIPGYTESGSNYMSHTNGIPSMKLGDALYFRVYAKLSDGTYAYSATAGYHAVAYAKDILANSTNAKMKSLVVAMLNYGAAAQVHFDYKTDALVNSFLTDEQKALVSDYSADMVEGIIPADSSKTGNFKAVSGGYSALAPNVVFEGAFSINYYFTPAKAIDGELKLYYWKLDDYNAADVLTADNATGVVIMEETSVAGQYLGAVPEIAAKQIDQTVYVCGVYESNGVSYPTGVIAYSLGAYCLDRMSKGTETMKAFAAETIVYGYYAKNYFSS